MNRWIATLFLATLVAGTARARDGDFYLGFGALGFGTRLIGFESSNLSPSRYDDPRALVVLSDGSIVAMGQVPGDEANPFSTEAIGLVRLTPTGARVNAFGDRGNGTLIIGQPLANGFAMNAIACDAQDRLYLVGRLGDTGIVYRHDALGAPLGFSAVSAAGLDLAQQGVELTDIELLPDGGFVAAGFVTDGANADFVIGRWKADGTIDATFGIDAGYSRVDFDLDLGSNDRGVALVRRANGGWLVGGTVSAGDRDLGIAAFTAEGLPDAGFTGTLGTPGRTTFHFDEPTSDDVMVGLAELPGGRILAYAGVDGTDSDGFRREAIAALTAQGFPDIGFAPQGRFRLPALIGFGDEEPAAMVMQADGKVIVAATKYTEGENGPDWSDIHVRRVLPSGAIDGDFGDSLPVPLPIQIIDFADLADEDRFDVARGLALAPDAVYVLGQFVQPPDPGADAEFGIAKLVVGGDDGFADGFEAP